MKSEEHECPICRIQHPPKAPFRFRIMGRFWEDKEDRELGSAMRLLGAKDFVEIFKKWPAVNPDSLSIVDTDTHPTTKVKVNE